MLGNRDLAPPLSNEWLRGVVKPQEGEKVPLTFGPYQLNSQGLLTRPLALRRRRRLGPTAIRLRCRIGGLGNRRERYPHPGTRTGSA